MILLRYLPLPSMIYFGKVSFWSWVKGHPRTFSIRSNKLRRLEESSVAVSIMDFVLYQYAWGHFHSVLTVVKEASHDDYSSARNELKSS